MSTFQFAYHDLHVCIYRREIYGQNLIFADDLDSLVTFQYAYHDLHVCIIGRKYIDKI